MNLDDNHPLIPLSTRTGPTGPAAQRPYGSAAQRKANTCAASGAAVNVRGALTDTTGQAARRLYRNLPHSGPTGTVTLSVSTRHALEPGRVSRLLCGRGRLCVRCSLRHYEPQSGVGKSPGLKEVAMTQWDFAVNLEQLLTSAGQVGGPTSMLDMMRTASAVVAQSRRDDPAGLHRWLDENADALVGQQLLIASVHVQPSPGAALPRALNDWLEGRGSETATEAVAWLKENHPGLLRAWLLSRVDEMIAAELAANPADRAGSTT